MHIDQSLEIPALRSFNANYSTLSQTEPTRPEVEVPEPNGLSVSDVAWFFLPIWFLVLLVICAFAISETWQATRDGLSALKYINKVPCRNCRFFSRNLHLQCAVRPLDALTERAIDCSDYCSKHSTDKTSYDKPPNSGSSKLIDRR